RDAARSGTRDRVGSGFQSQEAAHPRIPLPAQGLSVDPILGGLSTHTETCARHGVWNTGVRCAAPGSDRRRRDIRYAKLSMAAREIEDRNALPVLLRAPTGRLEQDRRCQARQWPDRDRGSQHWKANNACGVLGVAMRSAAITLLLCVVICSA